jgi:hypothetical protein
MRRQAAAGALALGAAAAGWLGFSSLAGGDQAENPPASRPGSTATVTRQTLVARELVEGALGYADARTIANRLESGGDSAGSRRRRRRSRWRRRRRPRLRRR